MIHVNSVSTGKIGFSVRGLELPAERVVLIFVVTILNDALKYDWDIAQQERCSTWCNCKFSDMMNAYKEVLKFTT